MKKTIFFFIMTMTTLSCFCEEDRKEKQSIVYDGHPKKSPKREGITFHENNGIAIFNFNKNYSDVRIVLQFDGQTQLLDEIEEIISGQQNTYYIVKDVRAIYVYSGNQIVCTCIR